MAKTANISLRIEPDIKAQAEAVFSNLGISVTDAINVFLHSSILVGGFPFQPRKPKYSAETLAALKESDDIANGRIPAKSYSNAAELIREAQESLDAED
ncbi:MAG: type II toxin-antitoxin system RelB/DinJ family antitoxin [Selenomonas ruminantium]|jgi:DNA-damage-inducible protein J|uniref:Type II toxin-antitoxin system RelB/DinJ family antitoxin n=1 Tax=Selenomonas ruminantium TaxID=971 RepID=A0A927ZYN6_SELRU|nr:type II toxin-antitoxin system RelB/DinJ family antitoxin [Selenomonas ruminantium]MBE6084733.1 type II toxin-antitoxin system RelB/DinJ family antitoxin [Selenomonas ruminantium]